jgi:hypothetical protein
VERRTMRKFVGFFLCVMLFNSIVLADGKTNTSQRQRFIAGPSTACWMCLRAFPDPDSDRLALQAWTGIKNKFPVSKEGESTLFEVLTKAGDDDSFALEILSKEGAQSVDVKRDQAVKFVVTGVEYEVYYPSLYVAAKKEPSTSTTVMLIISTAKK